MRGVQAKTSASNKQCLCLKCCLCTPSLRSCDGLLIGEGFRIPVVFSPFPWKLCCQQCCWSYCDQPPPGMLEMVQGRAVGREGAWNLTASANVRPESQNSACSWQAPQHSSHSTFGTTRNNLSLPLLPACVSHQISHGLIPYLLVSSPYLACYIYPSDPTSPCPHSKFSNPRGRSPAKPCSVNIPSPQCPHWICSLPPLLSHFSF